jgi:His/Glu/Gln/Arg/opine family amino acid ABC transporter permease subunit
LFKVNHIQSFIFFLVFFSLQLLLTPLQVSAQETEDPFVVALTGKYPPFSFYSPEGELAGFDVDVAKEIAGEMGRPVEFVTIEWDGILAGLLSGKFDAIIGSMAITPERRKKVNFSDPYYVSGAQLFIHESGSDSIHSINECSGRSIGVGLGETYEHYLRSAFPGINVISYRSTIDIFQDMENGRLAGFVTDKLVGLYQIKSGHWQFVPAGPLIYEERMGIPVKISNHSLLEEINQALSRIRISGRMDVLYGKWFGDTTEIGQNRERITAAVQIRMLGRGFALTIFVAITSLIAGFFISIPWGIILNSSRSIVYAVLRFINDFIRGTPLLIQLFFVYFGAPQIGITLTPIQSAVLTLTVSCAAYMSEAIRSGLMAVDRGQSLAGRSLALSRFQVFLYIVWPQAFRISIPALMNIVVAFIKDTALISVISIAEVVREAQSIISVTYNPIRYYFIVGIMFFVITFPLMKLSGRLERHIKSRGFVYD